MLSSTAEMIVKTRLFAGGQHRFSLPGIIDLKKKPLK